MWIIWLLGCNGPAHDHTHDHDGHAHDHGEHATPDPAGGAAHTEEGHGHEHAPPEHAEGKHPGHGDHATVSHTFEDVEKWARVFDDPERDAWQKPAELVDALEIAEGTTVVDLGAGTGYFLPHLARAVGSGGKVVAIDIEQSLVDHMAERTKELSQVDVRLATPDDPKLKDGEADVVILVDVYHHIDARTEYFTGVREAMKPGGRLVIVDFKPGDLPVGPPPHHRVPQDQVVAELAEAGWTEADSLDVLPYQFVQVVTAP